MSSSCGIDESGIILPKGRRITTMVSSHFNVWNTCLHILRERGFELEVDGESLPDGSYPPNALWIAHKDGFSFCGDNPIELLGLVAIYDHLKPTENRNYWWRIDGPDIWLELMEKTFPDKEDNPA
jgi:hypothetical protein